MNCPAQNGTDQTAFEPLLDSIKSGLSGIQIIGCSRNAHELHYESFIPILVRFTEVIGDILLLFLSDE